MRTSGHNPPCLACNNQDCKQQSPHSYQACTPCAAWARLRSVGLAASQFSQRPLGVELCLGLGSGASHGRACAASGWPRRSSRIAPWAWSTGGRTRRRPPWSPPPSATSARRRPTLPPPRRAPARLRQGSRRPRRARPAGLPAALQLHAPAAESTKSHEAQAGHGTWESNGEGNSMLKAEVVHHWLHHSSMHRLHSCWRPTSAPRTQYSMTLVSSDRTTTASLCMTERRQNANPHITCESFAGLLVTTPRPICTQPCAQRRPGGLQLGPSQTLFTDADPPAAHPSAPPAMAPPWRCHPRA